MKENFNETIRVLLFIVLVLAFLTSGTDSKDETNCYKELKLWKKRCAVIYDAFEEADNCYQENIKVLERVQEDTLYHWLQDHSNRMKIKKCIDALNNKRSR